MSVVSFVRVAGDPNSQAPAQIHRVCIHCEGEVIFLMTQNQYDDWQVKNNYVQDVFPHLDVETREWMISGTHPHCWKEVFGEDDEQEDYF